MALWAIFSYNHLNGHRDDDELMIEGEEGGKGQVRSRALAPFDTDPNFDLVPRPKRVISVIICPSERRASSFKCIWLKTDLTVFFDSLVSKQQS